MVRISQQPQINHIPPNARGPQQTPSTPVQQPPTPPVQKPVTPAQQTPPKNKLNLLRQQQLTSPAKQKSITTLIQQRGVVKTGPQPPLNLLQKHTATTQSVRPTAEEGPEREEEQRSDPNKSTDKTETSTLKQEASTHTESTTQQQQEPIPKENTPTQQKQQESDPDGGGRGKGQQQQREKESSSEEQESDEDSTKPTSLDSSGPLRAVKQTVTAETAVTQNLPIETAVVAKITPTGQTWTKASPTRSGSDRSDHDGALSSGPSIRGPLQTDTQALKTKWARTELAPLDDLLSATFATPGLKPQDCAKLTRKLVESQPTGSDMLSSLILASPEHQRQELARVMAGTLPELKGPAAQKQQALARAQVLYSQLEGLFEQMGHQDLQSLAGKQTRASIAELGKEFNALTGNDIAFGQKFAMHPSWKPVNSGFYEMLPPAKQQQVDAALAGIAAARFPNSVSHSHPQQVKLDAERTVTVDMPDRLQLHGRSYGMIKKLGAGADGVAFLMQELGKDGKVLPHGRKIVAKAMVDPNNPENRSNMVNEVLAHQHAMGPMGKGNKNLLQLEGIVKHGDNFLVVTEFAGGGDLRGVFDKLQSSALPPEQKQLLGRLLMRDVLNGMKYLEAQRGVGHYDMKPENCFVRADGTAMVADMGRANMNLETTRVEGTMPYLSPERHPSYKHRSAPDYKADIYTLGIMLFEAVEGKHPRASGTAPDGTAILSPSKWSNFRQTGPGKPKLSEEDQILNAMMAENPAERPNLSAVLSSNYFKDPALDNPALRQQLARIITA